VGGLETLLVDRKVEVKVSLKLAPMSVTLNWDKVEAPPGADNDQSKDTWKWSAKAEAKKADIAGTKVTGSISASVSGPPSSSDQPTPQAGSQGTTNEAASHVIGKWSVGGAAEAGNVQAKVERTSATGKEPETDVELGHWKRSAAPAKRVDDGSAPVSPATNASPAVDYTHGSSVVP
jgi:hypothetical protein